MTMITPSYLGETIEYSSLHACRSTLEDPTESAFVACSFWMIQNLAGVGRRSEAERLFEKLLARRNDLGLLSEEFDLETGHFMGNFPQALSHIALINAARMLSSH